MADMKTGGVITDITIINVIADTLRSTLTRSSLTWSSLTSVITDMAITDMVVSDAVAHGPASPDMICDMIYDHISDMINDHISDMIYDHIISDDTVMHMVRHPRIHLLPIGDMVITNMGHH